MGPKGKNKPIAKSERLTVGKKTLAIGMHWYVHGQKEKRAVNRAASECKASFGYRIDAKENSLTGFYNGAKASKKLYAGAPVIASVYEEGIFIVPCGDDQYWLSVISRGQPIAGYDLVCSADIAKATVTQLKTVNDEMSVFSELAFAQEHLPDEEFHTAINVNDLFHHERLSAEFALSRQAKKYLEYAPHAAVASTLIAVGVIVVPKILMGDTVSTAQQQRIKDNWITQAQWEKESIINSYNRTASTYPIDNWASSLLKTLNQIPLETAGWLFSELECTADQSYCRIEWENSGYGTFASLNYTAGHLGKMTLVNPDTVTQAISIVQPQGSSFNEVEVKKRLKNLPSVDEFKLDHVSVLQLLRTVPNLEFNVDSPSPGPRISMSPVGVEQSINFPSFDSGKWELQGRGLHILVDSVLKLDPDVYFGQTLNVKIIYNRHAISADWKIGGEYVSKS